MTWCMELLGSDAVQSPHSCQDASNNWINDYSDSSAPVPWTSTAEACASPGSGGYDYYARSCCADTLSACYDPDGPASYVCFSDCANNNDNLCELAEFGTACSDDCRDVDKEYLCTACRYPEGLSGELEPLCSEFFPDVTPVDLSCIADWSCDGPLSTLDGCDQTALDLVCGFCYNDGNGADDDDESGVYDPARFVDLCLGSCFAGDSTVSVFEPSTRGSRSVALRDLSVGARVLAVDKATRKETFVRVAALPHSPSHGEFVEITAAGAALSEEEARSGSSRGGSGSASLPSLPHTVAATEYHTFPVCDTKFRKEVAAKDLKVGDCLLTAGGRKSTVSSVRRRLAAAADDTYTVVLEGAEDLVVVNGVVTHARPTRPEAAKSLGATAARAARKAGPAAETLQSNAESQKGHEGALANKHKKMISAMKTNSESQKARVGDLLKQYHESLGSKHKD